MRSVKAVSRRGKSGRRRIDADGTMSTMIVGTCRRSVSCAGDDRSASSSHAPRRASAASPRRIRYGRRTHTARRTAISRPRSGRLRRRNHFGDHMGNIVESHVTRCIGSLDRHERAYVARAVAWTATGFSTRISAAKSEFSPRPNLSWSAASRSSACCRTHPMRRSRSACRRGSRLDRFQAGRPRRRKTAG